MVPKAIKTVHIGFIDTVTRWGIRCNLFCQQTHVKLQNTKCLWLRICLKFEVRVLIWFLIFGVNTFS